MNGHSCSIDHIVVYLVKNHSIISEIREVYIPNLTEQQERGSRSVTRMRKRGGELRSWR
jgi:hypothetical protein